MLDPPAAQPFVSVGELSTALERSDAGVAVLTVDGEIDTLTAPPLERAVGELLATPAITVLAIDLCGVTFLASSGLAVLIRSAHHAAELGLRLRLVLGSRAVRRPLEVTGSDQLFDLFDDRAAALTPSD